MRNNNTLPPSLTQAIELSDNSSQAMNTTNMTIVDIPVQIEVEPTVIRLSEAARLAGLFLMPICVVLAVGFIIWVLWNRKQPTVQMMQPVFLLMLCLGSIFTSLAVIILGSNDQNTENINAACLAYPWLYYMGSTVSLSALFSKLWRVNQIFKAKGFERKVVTARDVLGPFATLTSINLTLLIVMSAVDPPTWQQNTVQQGPFHTIVYGRCAFTTTTGLVLDGILRMLTLVPAIFLSIQAYRARDIKTEFSEARGVALAMFLWVQSIIIYIPTSSVIADTNVDAQYVLQVTISFVNGTSLLIFIFAPIIAHHRHRYRHGRSIGAKGNTRVTGLDFASHELPTASVAEQDLMDSVAPRRRSVPADFNQTDKKTSVSEMGLELQALRTRVAELESENAAKEVEANP